MLFITFLPYPFPAPTLPTAASIAPLPPPSANAVDHRPPTLRLPPSHTLFRHLTPLHLTRSIAPARYPSDDAFAPPPSHSLAPPPPSTISMSLLPLAFVAPVDLRPLCSPISASCHHHCRSSPISTIASSTFCRSKQQPTTNSDNLLQRVCSCPSVIAVGVARLEDCTAVVDVARTEYHTSAVDAITSFVGHHRLCCCPRRHCGHAWPPSPSTISPIAGCRSIPLACSSPSANIAAIAIELGSRHDLPLTLLLVHVKKRKQNNGKL